jgi:hypothetical protein
MHATITAALSDEFIDTAENVLFLAWKHAGGEHVCDHHAPIVWDMAMVRAKSALRVLTACTSEQADEALEQALQSEEG